jgi:hypothetical protein
VLAWRVTAKRYCHLYNLEPSQANSIIGKDFKINALHSGFVFLFRPFIIVEKASSQSAGVVVGH